MVEFVSKHKVAVIIVVVVIVLIYGVRGYNAKVQADRIAEQQKQEEEQREREEMEEANDESNTNDSQLLSMQPDLIQEYGKLPKGYIWDLDGSLFSLGDKTLSAEEVVYSYLNGLRTLDFSTVQKFSRGSTVVENYEGYFSDKEKNTDYTDNFIRNMYKQALLSMQIEGVVNSTVFAENKEVFTVKVKMLDLTLKDFWLKDKPTIYKNMQIYSTDEDDTTKMDIYLYDYVAKYYSAKNAPTRSVSFDLTVQRYPDLDTGWLISVDTDVDNACRYTDGKLVVSYIKEKYYDEGKDYLDALARGEDPEKAVNGDSTDEDESSSTDGNGSDSIFNTNDDAGFDIKSSDDISTGGN